MWEKNDNVLNRAPRAGYHFQPAENALVENTVHCSDAIVDHLKSFGDDFMALLWPVKLLYLMIKEICVIIRLMVMLVLCSIVG